ncbi:selenium metabolism-associated LysR family transcriptional regulator [Peptococcaceae bacterium 1198_IL3148]
MNTTLLRTFVTVVNKQSLSLAAQEIHITQPAVSKHINTLEEYFGVGLIERRGRGVTLTPAGTILYHYANEVLGLLNKAEREIRDLSATVKGKLVIWASSIPGHYILPYIIGEFKKQYPEVHISLQISDSNDVIHHLLDETAQLGAVGTKPDNKKLETKNFYPDELVVITPKDHPLAGKKSISLSELTKEKLIWRSIGSGTRKMLEEKLAQLRLSLEELNIVMELGSTGAIVTAVQAGLGVSIVSKWAIYKEKSMGEIAVLEINDLNMERNLYLCYPKKRYQNRVVQAFLEFANSDAYTLPQIDKD